MNKIRYWKRIYNLACGLYNNEGKKMENDFLKRVYNTTAELGDYIENLEINLKIKNSE
jgi:hypothetical protein